GDEIRPAASYRQFVSRHVDQPKTNAPNNNAYCNRLMQSRGLTCKLTNTFIHNPLNEVKAICTHGGTRFRNNLFDSNRSFTLTVCRLVSRGRRRRCAYRGTSQTRRIRVACTNQMPVHFERIL
uniref:Ribonuclease A family member 4 n=1 Tax=Crocodylus porosus TaxID=8502 RepID=A0A7M4F2S2_CROPO